MTDLSARRWLTEVSAIRRGGRGKTTYDESLGFAVPFIDLRAQYRNLENEIGTALEKVIRRQWFILGEEVAALEREYSHYLDGRHCVTCGSGTDALFLALKAWHIGSGDKVIVPSFTFAATAQAVLAAGAIPVFADVDPRTRTLSPASFERMITDGVRAVIPVHLYGHPAAMEEITPIAREHEILVLEDACQSHHAFRKGKRIGTLGDAAAFSFYPGKNLGGFSDGGMVAFENPQRADRARVAAQYGMQGDECILGGGINSNLSEIDAAVLRVKFPHLAEWTARRREIARQYTDLLQDVATCPKPEPDVECVYHAYVIEVPDRDRVEAVLIRRGIQVRIHYRTPLHRHPGLSGYHDGRVGLPVSDHLAKHVLSLPSYPEMTDETVRFVARCVREAVRG